MKGEESMRKRTMMFIIAIATFVVTVGIVPSGLSQTASTGALTGTVSDSSRAVLPGVEVKLTNTANGESRSVVSNETGSYIFPLLAPSSYRLEAALPGFKTAVRSDVRITVTETARLDVQLELGALTETVNVEATPQMVQQETSALGRVVNEVVVSSLPLSTRNFTQILGLSTGVVANVNNAAALGRGPGGTGISVNGSTTVDNNFNIDGADTNDSNSTATAGTAIPNPDMIAEFKVQTAQADASYGRNSGGQINIVTKSGTNNYHGSLFEFFRNEALNANDFFFNKTGQPKPEIRQNQFGGTLGGPLIREKLLFFGGYQRTQQAYGVGGNCNRSFNMPPLTDDRSVAALGALFAGQSGQNGGVAIKADGSNINPIAVALLNAKTPTGEYLFPTPQSVDRSRPFASQGFSTYSQACEFGENQYMFNLDYLQNAKSKVALRHFNARSITTSPLAAGNIAPGAAPGTQFVKFELTSLTHTYVITPRIFNELKGSFFNNGTWSKRDTFFKYSDFGIATPFPATMDRRPAFSITGSYSVSPSSNVVFPEKTWAIQDNVSLVFGTHTVRTGFAVTRAQIRLQSNGASAGLITEGLTFLSFPDFLLGMSAAENGSQFSNINISVAAPGIRIKNNQMWHRDAYVQDDWKITPRLTTNLGIRYAGVGMPTDSFGGNVNFDPSLANPNPPAAGTFAGYVIPTNFRPPFPDCCPGATRGKNTAGMDREVLNLWSPRLGFAWKVLANSNRLLLRGGYGLYLSNQTNPAQGNQGSLSFGGETSRTGVANAVATWANPYPAVPATFTYDQNNINWGQAPITNTSTVNVFALDPNYTVPHTHKYSLNIQSELARNFLLEVGYVGARGFDRTNSIQFNHALLASPSSPIRGITTNTVANVNQRVPYLGISAVQTANRFITPNGKSTYNSLQASLTKRFSRGLQFTGGYTWSKTLDTAGTSSQNNAQNTVGVGKTWDATANFGPVETNHAHRFVFSYVYQLPNVAKNQRLLGALLGRWSVSGVTTIQSGVPLSILYTNSNNIYGTTSDRASMATGCTYADLLSRGPVKQRLNQYFNTACITAPSVIGDDGRATDFGNMGSGIVSGPGQQNTDMSLKKDISLGADANRRMEFRAEFFNLFNHAQFSNPATTFNNATFGQITSTSVNPRFVQLALKIGF
jgi:hypothetical protein